jgi:hypothetical protein
MRLLYLALLLAIPLTVAAQEKNEPVGPRVEAPARHESSAAHAEESAPAVSPDASWATPILSIILILFAGAIVIGPIIRANTPEELPPPAHSLDEPPGASGHHGTSGTLTEPPPDVAYEEGHAPKPDHGHRHH